MSLRDRVCEEWTNAGLICDGRWNPTFIEDVGAAAAENVRSAALCRWMRQNPKATTEWLQEEAHVELDSTSLRVNREKTIPKVGRIDLHLEDDSGKSVYIEVKWSAALSQNQLRRYHEYVKSRKGVQKLVILSPIRHVYRLGAKVPPELASTDWSSLAPYVNSPGDKRRDRSVEDDLGATLCRWRILEDQVRKAAREASTRLQEFSDLAQWLSECTGDGELDSAGYRELVFQLVLAALADSFQKRVGEKVVRVGTHKGEHGDFGTDLCSPNEEQRPELLETPGPAWPAGTDKVFLLTTLRLQTYGYSERSEDPNPIRVQAGTAVFPYLHAKERSEVSKEKAEYEELFKEVGKLRDKLMREAQKAKHKNEPLKTTGSPFTKQWWKCFINQPYDPNSTVQELHELMLEVARIISSDKELQLISP